MNDAPSIPSVDLPALERLVEQLQAQVHEQQRTIAELAREKQSLQHRMEQLLRRLYGRRSERLDAAQLLLFGRLLEQAGLGADPDVQPAPKPPPQKVEARRARPHGRRPLPENLPRYRIEYPVDPADLACPCGRTCCRIGEEVSEQLEYSPACLFVIEHVRPKFACKVCEEGVVIADKPPQPIEKGLAGPGLIAYVITSKYADHLPLYRLEGIIARLGVDLDRSTLGGWVAAAADLLLPLWLLMGAIVRQSRVICTDDTTVPVLDEYKSTTRTGRLWLYLGDASHPCNVFDYTPDRGGQHPQRWLEGFCGFLQADAFAGYDAIYATGKVIEVACWAHTRRKFYDARDSDPLPAHQALAFIRQLYEVEAAAREKDAAGRLELRQQKALPVLNDMHAWLGQQQTQALPKSPLGQAIGYALNNWAALICYASDSDLAIDNNVSEREMKSVAIGRKNWMFAGSDEGGKRAAVLYSFVSTCRRHGVDPQAWFRDVLARIPSTSMSQLGQFLPDRWKASLGASPSPQQRPPPQTPSRPAG